jgi:flap endonuclease-1
LTGTNSEERVRKGAEKLAKSLNAKQQGRLDGFFTATPKASAPKPSGKNVKGKDDKGKGTKRKVSHRLCLPYGILFGILTYEMKAEDKEEAKGGKKSKAKK